MPRQRPLVHVLPLFCLHFQVMSSFTHSHSSLSTNSTATVEMRPGLATPRFVLRRAFALRLALAITPSRLVGPTTTLPEPLRQRLSARPLFQAQSWISTPIPGSRAHDPVAKESID